MAALNKKLKILSLGIFLMLVYIFGVQKDKTGPSSNVHSKYGILQFSATAAGKQDEKVGNESKVWLIEPEPFTKEDLKAIKSYHDEQEKFCSGKLKNETKKVKWCPCVPPNLKGRLDRNIFDDTSWEELERTIGEDVLVGGEWKPPDCVAHTRLAVIIPCRDRDSNLRVTLRHLYPILQRQKVHFRIFIADQRSPVVFNKAASMNIGFLEAIKRFNFNCAMFHDVDHLLEDDRTLLNCGAFPHHYAVSMDEWGYKLIYGGLFGGVVSMTPKMFRRINGYSIEFFGWGGEDDDMGTRVRQFWRVYRPPKQIARYTTLKHQLDSSNPKNGHRIGIMSRQRANYKNGTFEGLTDLRYKVVEVRSNALFTKVLADIDVSNLQYNHANEYSRDYLKVSGVCMNSNNVVETKDVSIQTCRFACEKYAHKPCHGFSYRPDGGSSRCSLLTTACHLTQNNLGVTFIRYISTTLPDRYKQNFQINETLST